MCAALRRPRSARLLTTLPAVALAGLAFVAASSARGVSLPNPCTILASAHAQSVTAKAAATASGHAEDVRLGQVRAGDLRRDGRDGQGLPLLLHERGRLRRRQIVSQSHPTGFGGTATLTVGTGAGSGAPVDYIVFRKGPLYADLSANGAEPSKLTTLGQEVYKLTPNKYTGFAVDRYGRRRPEHARSVFSNPVASGVSERQLGTVGNGSPPRGRRPEGAQRVARRWSKPGVVASGFLHRTMCEREAIAREPGLAAPYVLGRPRLISATRSSILAFAAAAASRSPSRRAVFAVALAALTSALISSTQARANFWWAACFVTPIAAPIAPQE